jgi:signal transduction histidine kinase
LPGPLVALEFILRPVLLLGIAGSIAQLVVRLRRSRGEEREQLKWFAYAGIMAPLITLALSSGRLGNIAWTLGPLSLVAGVGIAVLKYRLYDIDVVINKTVVFGGLAAFITAVYVGIVVGIGAAIGQGSKPNLGLSILATAVVAVAFQPVRERVQRLANRLVYGRRATPYEVLSEFSSRMAGAYESEDLLPRMARILGEGTGAGSTRVWLKVGDELRAEATWPTSEDSRTLPMEDGALPAMADTSLLLPVRHRGDLLGALSLTKLPGERLTPTEEKLATDLASGAGLVLRNVRLTEELLARLEELRASRQRLVAAQDAERRRLERNIHDGAQQQLVALAVKIRLARQLETTDPAKANRLLEQTEQEVSQALEDLRDLARGIYPPLLADRGLVAALSSQAQRSLVPVEIRAEGIGRFPQEAEAAVYFCCLEALQNVAKYANASSAGIRLAGGDEDLTFEVSDDGVGFDPGARGYGTGLQGMADRLAALGGELRVDSALGGGTIVHGRLPAQTLERVG